MPPEEAAKVKRETIISSRVVYMDKNSKARKGGADVPLHPKEPLCVRGFQERELGGFRRHAPTAPQLAEHLVFVVACARGWALESAAVESAYFQGYDMTHEVYSMPPNEGIPGAARGSLIRALKPIYGFTDVGRAFWLKLRETLVNGLVQSAFEPAMFLLTDETGRNVAMLCSRVDDLLQAYDPNSETEDESSRRLQLRLVGDGRVQEHGPALQADRPPHRDRHGRVNRIDLAGPCSARP